MSTDVIYVPQQFSLVITNSLTIFLEVIFIPAALLAILGGAGQITLGIIAVFVWRIIAGIARWSFIGVIPATSILTFLMLSAKTGAGASFGITSGEASAIVAYVLPGCIVSFIVGIIFIVSSLGSKPIVMNLAEDFVTLTSEAKFRLLELFKALTFLIGAVHVIFATAGAIVVIIIEEQKASVLIGGLSVATHLVIVLTSVMVSFFLLRRSSTILRFKQEPVIEASLS